MSICFGDPATNGIYSELLAALAHKLQEMEEEKKRDFDRLFGDLSCHDSKSRSSQLGRQTWTYPSDTSC